MNTETKLSPLRIAAYHDKATTAAFTDWNGELELVNKRRKELSADADKLREAMIADDGKPENIPAEVLKLYGRRLALDIAEAKLYEGKHEFKNAHLKARAAERDRLAGLEKQRAEEIKKALLKAGIATPFEQGIANSDEKIRALRAARAAVSSFENVVTAEDEQRAEFLVARIREAVPQF